MEGPEVVGAVMGEHQGEEQESAVEETHSFRNLT